MGRGYIYEVVSDIERAGHMSASDFYNFQDYIADYVADVEPENSEEVVEFLLEELKNSGAEIGWDETEEGRIPYFFMKDRTVKENYFRAQFLLFKRLAGEMTLEKFAEAYGTYEIEDSIACQYASAMFLDGGYYDSLDDGVRRLEPGIRYYIGSVVYMH